MVKGEIGRSRMQSENVREFSVQIDIVRGIVVLDEMAEMNQLKDEVTRLNRIE